MTGSIHFHSAYVPHDLPQPVMGAESGPLAGMTVAVKDMFDIAGQRTGGGSPAWLDAQAPAERNCAVVDRLLSAGASVVGKTVCDEFFYSVTGTNHHYGVPLNPRAPGRIPGGSSSGSASASSAGSCDLALGSDTGGSVRVPASLCGVYGIRVSRGRMDMRGAMAMAPSFDSGGWFSAVPGVFGRAGQVLLEDFRPACEPPARFRLASDMFANAEPGVARLCKEFLDALGDSLRFGTDVEIAGTDIDGWREAFRVVQAFEVWTSFGDFIETARPLLGPGTLERMTDARTVSAEAAAQARTTLASVEAHMEALTSGRTVLVFPTCPVTAPDARSSPEELARYRVRTMRMVCAASISGLPQVTVPIGTLGGAPVGLSFLGWRHGDEALLALVRGLSRHVGVAA